MAVKVRSWRMEKQSVESKGSGVSTPDGGAPSPPVWGGPLVAPGMELEPWACRGKEPKWGEAGEAPSDGPSRSFR